MYVSEYVSLNTDADICDFGVVDNNTVAWLERLGWP